MTARRAGGALVLLGLVAVSVNLRPAAVSVGPVLAEVRTAFAMSPASAGLLTSLPVVAFAVFGALTPTAARRLGRHRLTLLALLAVVIGLGGRALAGSEATFLALSLLALGGMAMGNVLMPSLVKQHFPDRVGPVTAVYTTALAVGLTGAIMLTAPIAEAAGDAGGWRWGLGTWAVLAAVAALPWLGLLRDDESRAEAGRPAVRVTAVARTPLGVALALCFGLQSLQAYSVFGWMPQIWRDSGYSAVQAGLLTGLLAGTSIPLSSWLPRRLASTDHPRRLMLAVVACYPLGYLGMAVAPFSLALLWALVVGAGACFFPLVLTLIGLRARTAEGTAALSAFSQSAGYLLAVVGPFAVGVVHGATGSWTPPLLMLAALALLLVPLVWYLGRPLQVEDQL